MLLVFKNSYVMSSNDIFKQDYRTFLSFFFLTALTACGISVVRPGMEPAPLAVEAQSLNH